MLQGIIDDGASGVKRPDLESRKRDSIPFQPGRELTIRCMLNVYGVSVPPADR